MCPRSGKFDWRAYGFYRRICAACCLNLWNLGGCPSSYVVNENARVLASTVALEAGHIKTFGQYMIKSHESLRDLFEVTGWELDTLFDQARQVLKCIGTRMTGAGFGGCTVSLVHKDAVADFKTQVTQGYRAKTGLTPTFYIGESGDGACEILGR